MTLNEQKPALFAIRYKAPGIMDVCLEQARPIIIQKYNIKVKRPRKSIHGFLKVRI
jgi:hypothetical protein